MFKLNNILFVLINLCSILNGYELNKNVTAPTNNLNDSILVTPRPLMRPPISTQVETQETSTDGQTDETPDAQENSYLTTTSPTEQPTDIYHVVTHNKNDVYDDYEWKTFDDFVEIPIPERLHQRLEQLNNESLAQLKQLPTNPLTMLVQNTPCKCATGLCSCCTGMILSTFNSRACMNMKYIPEEFAFDFRVMMNNYQLFQRKISANNLNDSILVTPRPLMRPPISTQVETQETSTDGQTDETPDAQENSYLTTTSPTEQPTDIYHVVTHNKNDVYDDYEWKTFDDFVEIPIPERLQQRLEQLNNESLAQLKQLPTNPLTMLVQNTPCKCATGLCSCCTGMILSTFNSRACMNMKYIPEEFAFDFRVMMNNYQLFQRKISGRNPAPVCISPPRIPFVDVCATFSDIYFIGRNMHICLEVGGFFEGFELFNRNFNCMRIGQQGIKIVKPEDGGGIPQKPAAANGLDADVDQGDEIEEYDEILS